MVILMGSGPSGWAVIYPLVGDYVDGNWHFDIIPKIMALLKHLYPVTHFLMPSAMCPLAHFSRKVARQSNTRAIHKFTFRVTYLSIPGCHFDHVQWFEYVFNPSWFFFSDLVALQLWRGKKAIWVGQKACCGDSRNKKTLSGQMRPKLYYFWPCQKGCMWGNSTLLITLRTLTTDHTAKHGGGSIMLKGTVSIVS